MVSHLLDWTFQTAIHFKSRHWTKEIAACPREGPTGKGDGWALYPVC